MSNEKDFPIEKTPRESICIEDIAKICHAANREYCLAIGDNSVVVWDALDEPMKYSVRHGVKLVLAYLHKGALPPPFALHAEWCKIKSKQGWKYGPVKDTEAKEHPCLVPYDKLPGFQQLKDSIFQSIILAIYSSGIPIEIENIVSPEPASRIIIPS